MTTAISASGAVLGELPIFVEGTLVVETRLLELTTFYTKYGDVFAWGLVVVWVGTAGWRALRTRLATRHPERGAALPGALPSTDCR